jgi:hypothetical protein
LLTQPLLGERIQAALKPNRVVVVGSDETTKLAERHGTTVATLRNLNPNLSQRPADPGPPAASPLHRCRRTEAGPMQA